MIQFLNFNKEAPDFGYWDQSFILDVLSQINTEKIITIIPARQNSKYIDDIVKATKDSNIIILTGDEENEFPIEKLKDKIVYQMTPRVKNNFTTRYIPNGYAPSVNHIKQIKEPELRFSFAGQVTHKRRKQLMWAVEQLEGGKVIQTKGFTQGLPHPEYIELIQNSKVVLCPSGPITPDTFRLYETLETGNLPIVDKSDYWNLVFDNFPVPQLDNVDDIEGLINYHNDTFPKKANECFAWWQLYKRNLKYQIMEDLKMSESEEITVLIPTSPIKAHPSITIIQETIRTVRDRLPKSEIIIMFDGVREEQKELEQNYEKYKRQLLFWINQQDNITPLVFTEHTHQAMMTKKALEIVKTDYIMFVEHDTPLCEDIPFDNIIERLKNIDFNIIRLNHEALIIPDHEHMLLDYVEFDGVRYARTAQWSQRPHFSTTQFYRAIISKFFNDSSKTMIEDRIHGLPAEAFRLRGRNGWQEWKIGMYAPHGDQKRSYHTDGRGSEPKFNMIF